MVNWALKPVIYHHRPPPTPHPRHTYSLLCMPGCFVCVFFKIFYIYIYLFFIYFLVLMFLIDFLCYLLEQSLNSLFFFFFFFFFLKKKNPFSSLSLALSLSFSPPLFEQFQLLQLQTCERTPELWVVMVRTVTSPTETLAGTACASSQKETQERLTMSTQGM